MEADIRLWLRRLSRSSCSYRVSHSIQTSFKMSHIEESLGNGPSRFAQDFSQ